MTWRDQKFLIELELKRLEIRKERLLKWISFLQTTLLLIASATTGIAYKGEQDFWVWIGMLISTGIFIDIGIYYKKVERIEWSINALKLFL